MAVRAPTEAIHPVQVDAFGPIVVVAAEAVRDAVRFMRTAVPSAVGHTLTKPVIAKARGVRDEARQRRCDLTRVSATPRTFAGLDSLETDRRVSRLPYNVIHGGVSPTLTVCRSISQPAVTSYETQGSSLPTVFSTTPWSTSCASGARPARSGTAALGEPKKKG
jgi:hypothetical protein